MDFETSRPQETHRFIDQWDTNRNNESWTKVSRPTVRPRFFTAQESEGREAVCDAQCGTAAVPRQRCFKIEPPLAATVGTVRQIHAMMATPAEEEKLWLREEIRETKKKRDAVEEKLENAEGAEKERLQERLNKLEGQLEALYSKLPAAPGML